MAVKPHSEQDKEIFQMKGRARHKQKGLQFTNSYSRKSSTMLQCTEFLTATHKPWQRAPSPKAAIKPRSIDPSFRVYGQFQPPLFQLPPEHVQMRELKPTDISVRRTMSFTPDSRKSLKGQELRATDTSPLLLFPISFSVPHQSEKKTGCRTFLNRRNLSDLTRKPIKKL